MTLAHAAGDAVEPLFALRDDELVIVRATADDPQRLADALDGARRRLVEDGIVLAIGVSAVHPGLEHVPAAYAEACVARERVDRDSGGLLALSSLSPLDYLFARGADPTAWNLVARRLG